MRPTRSSPFDPDQLWQSASEPVFWLDPSLKLIWVNRAWEKWTGYAAESVVGLVCQAHGPARAGDLNDFMASFYPPVESLGGQPAATRALIFHASGEPAWHRLNYWPFRDEKGVLLGLLGLCAGGPGVELEPTRPSINFISICWKSSGRHRRSMGSIV